MTRRSRYGTRRCVAMNYLLCVNLSRLEADFPSELHRWIPPTATALEQPVCGDEQSARTEWIGAGRTECGGEMDRGSRRSAFGGLGVFGFSLCSALLPAGAADRSRLLAGRPSRGRLFSRGAAGRCWLFSRGAAGRCWLFSRGAAGRCWLFSRGEAPASQTGGGVSQARVPRCAMKSPDPGRVACPACWHDRGARRSTR